MMMMLAHYSTPYVHLEAKKPDLALSLVMHKQFLMWVMAAKTFNEPTAVREQFYLWAVFLFTAVGADKKNNLGEHLKHERRQPMHNLPM